MVIVLAQVIGLLAFVISLLAYHQKKKEKILESMILANILNLFHYWLLGAMSGGIVKIIALFRDFYILLKEKYSIFSSVFFFFLFVFLYIAVGIFSYTTIWSLFPILAAILYFISLWNGQVLMIKKAAFLSYFLWLIYNIFVFSVSGILANCISIVSTFIALKREKIE